MHNQSANAIGEVHVDREGEVVGVSMMLEPPVEDWMSDYSVMMVGEVRTQSQSYTWWHGGGSAATEEPIADDPPFSGVVWIPWESGEATLSLTMRLSLLDTNDQRDVLWLSGNVVLPDLEARKGLSMTLKGCDEIGGVPFQAPEYPVAPLVQEGPELWGPAVAESEFPEVHNPHGSGLPEVGVFDGNLQELVTPHGRIAYAFQPEGDCYLLQTFGGAGGALACVWQFRGLPAKRSLMLVRLPNGTPRFVDSETLVTASFDPAGEVLGIVHQTAQSSDLQVKLYETRTAKSLASAALVPIQVPEEFWDISLTWFEGALYVYRAGTLTKINAERATRSRAPQVTSVGWRHYGAGLPHYHPKPKRVARMLCAEFADADAGRPTGATLVVWVDDDSGRGQVVLPDQGAASEHGRFGNVTVLPDGRILAVGTRLWLIDPSQELGASTYVQDIGRSGAYPLFPRLTSHQGRTRLWSHGPGPWWIGFE